MKTSIVTRCWYKEQIPNIRIELFNNIFFPALNEQTDKDFDLYLLVYEHNIEQIKKQVNTLNVDVKFKIVKEEEVNDLRHPFNCGSNIQMRVDCDDYIYPNYVKTVKDFLIRKSNKYDNILLSFQPSKYDYFKKILHHSGTRYSEKRHSMFLCLYQKNSINGIYKYRHGHYHKHIKKSFFIKEQKYCNLVVHGDNTLTKI